VLAEIFLLGAVIAWIWQPWKSPEPVTTAADAADLATAAGGAAEPAEDSNAHQGMIYFVASESVYFLAIILGYVHLRLLQGTWPPPGMPKLGTSLPIVGALILLTSGLTAHWGLQQLRTDRQGWFRASIIVTALLGLSFLGIQAYEYAHVGFKLSSGVLGSAFFTLTGFHGAHVVAGIVVLVLMLAASWGARLTPRRRGMAEAGVLYWHFVDAVWIVLILVLYLF
jgi:cytochrome c oxidase subunit 3